MAPLLGSLPPRTALPSPFWVPEVEKPWDLRRSHALDKIAACPLALSWGDIIPLGVGKAAPSQSRSSGYSGLPPLAASWFPTLASFRSHSHPARSCLLAFHVSPLWHEDGQEDAKTSFSFPFPSSVRGRGRERRDRRDKRCVSPDRTRSMNGIQPLLCIQVH